MRRVLFVDDDAGVLEALKDMMRRHRGKWDLSFALGGEAARREFAARPFDVVITDLRMPVTDGATLLAEIQRDYPQTVRIILSGYAEPEFAARALRVAHQYLTKPCELEVLDRTVERACNLHDLVTDEKVRRVVGQIAALPSHPEVYRNLTRKLAEPDVSAQQIAAVLEKDMAMCAKLLQVVNSAFFGLPRRTTDIADAVQFVGFSLIRDLTLTLSIFNVASESKREAVEALQRHALLTAGIARRLADRATAEDAFMAGMLHDIGTLILNTQLPQLHQRVLEALRAKPRPLVEAEREVLGASHEDLGAYLLQLWALPPAIVEAVAYHHRPRAVPMTGFELPALVYVADRLAHELEGTPEAPGAALEPLDESWLRSLGVGDSLEEWREWAREFGEAKAA